MTIDDAVMILSVWKDEAEETASCIDILLSDLARLREENRWVPVTKRMPNPDKDESVLVWYEDGHGMAWYGWEYDEMEDTDRYGCDDFDGVAPHWHWCGDNIPVMPNIITHWRQLPRGPEGDRV